MLIMGHIVHTAGRALDGCSRGNAFWITHTGTWEFCVIKVKVMQELARPNSRIQSIRMVFWGMRVKKAAFVTFVPNR
jgi:hypothetical protein